jgi:hypothetical protein
MDDLERLETSIAQMRMKLTDMETAARVLRELRATTNGSVRRTRSRVADHEAAHAVAAKTITEHAREILATAGSGGMHFKDVATKALSHGYQGRKGTSEKAIKQSFWATMKRNDKIFKALGSGKFTLA